MVYIKDVHHQQLSFPALGNGKVLKATAKVLPSALSPCHTEGLWWWTCLTFTTFFCFIAMLQVPEAWLLEKYSIGEKILLEKDVMGERFYWGKVLLEKDVIGERFYWGKVLLEKDIIGETFYWRKVLFEAYLWLLEVVLEHWLDFGARLFCFLGFTCCIGDHVGPIKICCLVGFSMHW